MAWMDKRWMPGRDSSRTLIPKKTTLSNQRPSILGWKMKLAVVQRDIKKTQRVVETLLSVFILLSALSYHMSLD
jgi:hypothetical protein